MRKIIINALGVRDSGGVTVLFKTLKELVDDNNSKYIIILYKNYNTEKLTELFDKLSNIHFIYIHNELYLYRMIYENIILPIYVKIKKVDIIYNFSGSAQIWYRNIQIVKIHNLLFYSKQLDNHYFRNNKHLSWVKQILFKRIIFISMIKLAKYVEVQSGHVISNISNYVNIKEKVVFVKSDIDVDNIVHVKPKCYNPSTIYNILFIVGPHFKLLNKNIEDFNRAMLILKRRGLRFRILVTLTKKQLKNCNSWDASLTPHTQFLGYLSKSEVQSMFQNNSILVSTSIIETLGLHVIEAIFNGILVVTPKSDYSRFVYGKDIYTYKLFNPNSLADQICEIFKTPQIDLHTKILRSQTYLMEAEKDKIKNVSEIFDLIHI